MLILLGCASIRSIKVRVGAALLLGEAITVLALVAGAVFFFCCAKSDPLITSRPRAKDVIFINFRIVTFRGVDFDLNFQYRKYAVHPIQQYVHRVLL